MQAQGSPNVTSASQSNAGTGWNTMGESIPPLSLTRAKEIVDLTGRPVEGKTY
ncbi:hypothetical protein GCM10011352_02810 [Marinobacterium zhoushanense]|uniref:Uncharacterized protein n=1 Tax=Marinobacterium zhoushanense TaxID=1679163 RepID=A0ABQ1K166_9GAMM|nr:hypothetical protein GCM10011352_02810 [Marinobacterium zhoushanense]